MVRWCGGASNTHLDSLGYLKGRISVLSLDEGKINLHNPVAVCVASH